MNSNTTETGEERRQDLLLGLLFLFIAVFSSVRVYRSLRPTGGRKVITTFNFLIFLTAFSRALWFLIPNDFLESTYAPTPLVAFSSAGWIGVFFSEILLEVGSLSMYGIFILVACYWMHMLAKLEADTASEEVEDESLFMRIYGVLKISRRGTIQMFMIIMSVVGVVQLVGILLFLCQTFNSEQLLLFDSIFLSVLSVAIVAKITMLSNKIRHVLSNLEAINSRNSQPQIRRIYAIIVVAHVFFVTRVILEVTLAVCLVVLMKENNSFAVLLSDRFWGWYILLKHSSEVAVLGLELAISTAIRAYDTSSVTTRHQQQQGAANGAKPPVNSNSIRSSNSTPNDRSGIAYHKLPNYSSLEMSATTSAENTPLHPNVKNNLRVSV